MLRKIMIIIGVIFAPIGIILLVSCALTTMGSVHFRATAAQTTGTIVDSRSQLDCNNSSRRNSGCTTTFYPVVRYHAADGRQITFESNSGSNRPPQVGQQVTVLYQKDDPQAARLDSFAAFWLAPLVTGGLGLVFTGVGVTLVGLYLRRRRLDAWLDTHGRRIDAAVQGARMNLNVSINGVHPWQLFAGWLDPSTGRRYTFASENLPYNPTDRMAGQQTVQVLIDPSDPDGRYRMVLDRSAP